MKACNTSSPILSMLLLICCTRRRSRNSMHCSQRSGGSTSPPPEQRQRTYRTWSKTKTSRQLIKKQHLHTPPLKSFGRSLVSGCMFPRGFVASSTTGSFALYLEGAIWQNKKSIKNVFWMICLLARFQFKGYCNSLWCIKKKYILKWKQYIKIYSMVRLIWFWTENAVLTLSSRGHRWTSPFQTWFLWVSLSQRSFSSNPLLSHLRLHSQWCTDIPQTAWQRATLACWCQIDFNNLKSWGML